MDDVNLTINISISNEILLPTIEIKALDHALGQEEFHEWIPFGKSYTYNSIPERSDATTKVLTLAHLENPSNIISNIINNIDYYMDKPSTPIDYTLNGVSISDKSELKSLRSILKERLEEFMNSKTPEINFNDMLKEAIKKGSSTSVLGEISKDKMHLKCDNPRHTELSDNHLENLEEIGIILNDAKVFFDKTTSSSFKLKKSINTSDKHSIGNDILR